MKEEKGILLKKVIEEIMKDMKVEKQIVKVKKKF
jgi:hypothetical protein